MDYICRYLMATKKTAAKAAQAGPARVDSKSFNGARRAIVLRTHTAPREDSYFGAEFALIQLDHYPTPIWSTAKFLKKPGKSDLYETLRRAPVEETKKLLELDPVALVRRLAMVSGGQNLHHDASARWVGFARAMDVVTATDVLLSLIERINSDERALALDELATLDGSEYNKSDFKHGPRINGDDVDTILASGLRRLWPIELGDKHVSIESTLPPALLARAKAVVRHEEPAFWSEPLSLPPIERVISGLSKDNNARVGLDDEYSMIQGTGY